MKNIFIKFTILLSILGLVIFPKEVVLAGKEAMELCLYRVLPGLFPFFVLSELAIKLNVFSKLLKISNKIFGKILNIQDTTALLFGLIGGYPIGAKIVFSLYENKKINKQTAENMLAFCNNAGPAFIIGFVGMFLFSNKYIGYILLVSHILASFTVGIIFRGKKQNTYKFITNSSNNINFVTTFITAVNKGFTSCFMVTGFIVFFNIFTKLLICFNLLSTIAQILAIFLGKFNITTDEIIAFLAGIFEMTTGINYLANTQASNEIKIIITSFLLGFAGLSIDFQTISFNVGLSLKKYFYGKTIKGFFASIYSITIYKIIYTNELNSNQIFQIKFTHLLYIVPVLLFLYICFVKMIKKV